MARTSRKVLSTVAALSAAAAALLTLSTPAFSAGTTYKAIEGGVPIRSDARPDAPILAYTAKDALYEYYDNTAGPAHPPVCGSGETLGWSKIHFPGAGPSPDPNDPYVDVAYVPAPCLEPA